MLAVLLLWLMPVIASQDLVIPAPLNPLPSTPNQQPQRPKHTVTGAVTNAITGEPIRRALVQMVSQFPVSVLTGADGRFRFDDVAEGQLILIPMKPGFMDSRSLQSSEWGRAYEPLFRVGSGANDFQLKLYPGARIVGHVTNGDGEPIEGANVQVLAETIQQGRKQRQQRNGSATDDDGAFRLEELLPGRYLIFCSGSAIARANWNAPREVYPPVYYPDAKEAPAGQAIDLQPGQELVVDFHLHREHGYRVSAQVTTDARVHFGGGPRIENESGQIVNFGNMKFDEQRGQFITEGVPSGTWTLAFQGWDDKGNFYETRQAFTVDHADVNGLQVRAQANATIPVTVNHSAKAVQDSAAMGQTFQVMLSSTGDAAPRSFSAGAPPEMRFVNVAPGSYKLSVRSLGGECLASATYGSIDLTREELIIGPTTGEQPIVLDLTAQCAVLEMGLKPETKRAFAVITATSSSADPIVQPLTDGAESRLPLPSGTYEIYAFSGIGKLEYANPEAMRDYQSQSITLAAGEHHKIALEVTETKDK